MPTASAQWVEAITVHVPAGVAAVRLFLDIIDTGLVIVTLIDGEQVFTKDRIDSDLTALVIAIVILSRANTDSRTKSERAIQARRPAKVKAREHKIPISSVCPVWLSVVGKGDLRRFVVNKRRAKIVERIFKLSASGRGQYRMTEYPNRHRVPTLNGRPAWESAMRVLASKAVIGTFRPDRRANRVNRAHRGDDTRQPIEDYFPRIISRELDDRTRLATIKRLTRRKERGPRLHTNLLRGIGRCAVCGGTLHYLRSTRGFGYLRCAKSRHKLCSNRRGFPYRKLEPLLMAIDDLIEAVLPMSRDRPIRGAHTPVERSSPTGKSFSIVFGQPRR